MSEAERWHFGSRYYLTTLASTPTGMDLELEDVGPGAGRGTIALASLPDDAATISIQVLREHALPLELLRQFLDEAARRLPPAEG